MSLFLPDGHNLPIVFKESDVYFGYHYESSGDEMKVLRKQAIAKVQNDDFHYGNRHQNSAVMNSYKDAMNEAQTNDPRTSLDGYTEVEIFGVSTYLKDLTTVQTSIPNMPVQPNENVHFEMSVQVPGAPNKGGAGKNFFVYAMLNVCFVPEGCTWKRIRANCLDGGVIPFNHSDREPSFKIAADYGL